LKNRVARHTHVVDQVCRKCRSHLSFAGIESGRDLGKHPFVVRGAQRFDEPVAAFGKDATGIGMESRLFQDEAERLRSHSRHVTGDNQVPGRGAMGEGSFDTGEGSDGWNGTGTEVGNGRVGEVAVEFRRSDEGDATGGFANGFGGNFQQSAASDHQESLISPHAGTCAARQHISRRGHETDDIIRGLDNRKRVYRWFGRCGCGNGNFAGTTDIVRLNLNGNKMKKICSIIFGGMMVFSSGAQLGAQTAVPSHVTVVVHPDLQSGRLIQAVVVQPKEVAARVHEPLPETPSNVAVPLSSNIIEMIDQIATAYGVEGPLVHSVIRAESNYNAGALSNKGAMGMMQLIPSTARRFGVLNPFDPKQNIEGGVRYLRFLLDYYRNDYPKAIAAYNAGEGAVDRYQGIPPYSETRAYVYQVAKNLRAARQAEAAKTKGPQGKSTAENTPGEKASSNKSEAVKQEDVYNPIRASIAEDGRVYYRTQ
jgi:hypothetical protein